MNIREQTQFILDDFPFDSVQKVLIFMGQKIEKKKLVEEASLCMKNACESKETCNTQWFEAEYMEVPKELIVEDNTNEKIPFLELKFVLGRTNAIPEKINQ